MGFKSVLFPAAILSGTVIGAGMFALPFVFQQAGWLAGIFYLAAFVAVFSLVHLMYADIMLRTDYQPKFVSYVQTYLGQWLFWPAVIITVFGMFLILTVYLILSGSFVNLIIGQSVPNEAVLVLWLLGSAAVFFEIRKVVLSEFFITLAMAVIVILIFLAGVKEISAESFMQIKPVDFSQLFLPFGPILFALAGRTAIPSLVEYIKKEKLPEISLRPAIVFGTAFPALIYLLLIAGVFGLSGSVSQDAVSGLVKAGGAVKKYLGLLGFMALWSTYILIGISIKNILHYDLRWPRWAAGLVVVVAPLLLYLSGVQSFLFWVSIAGGIFIAIEAVLIVLVWRKLNSLSPKRVLLPAFADRLAYLLIFIFFAGAVYEIIYLAM